MQRNGENVAARIENILRAIAVMHIDVDDGHAVIALAQHFGGHRRPVQIAEAAGVFRTGVMARRAAQGIGRVQPALGHAARGAGRAVGAPPHGLPGVRTDRAGQVVHMKARAPDDALRVRRVWPAGMGIGNDFGAGIGQPRPQGMRVLKKIQIPSRMHAAQVLQAEVLGRMDGIAHGRHAFAQAGQARRDIGIGPHAAGHHEMLGLMLLLLIGVNHMHRGASIESLTRCACSGSVSYKSNGF